MSALDDLYAWADEHDAWVAFYRDPERDGRLPENRYEARLILGEKRLILWAPTRDEAAAAILAAAKEQS